MPVPGFLTSIADKAQSAISAAGAHAGRPTSPDAATQPSANEAAATGGHRNFAFESIQNQLRTFGQQYASTSPVQKIITVEKGIALDFESVSRDAKAQSKEFYTWGQTEEEDLKDVTDRLAYLNFIQGSLATTLSAKLVSARAPLKALRDAETALAPKRQLRATLQTQITRLEHDKGRGYEQKLTSLREQLQKAEVEDDAAEKEVQLLKRKGVRESEQLKWEAMREYGEKLVILSQAAPRITDALPPVPPTPNSPYSGHQTTGATRAALQRALDNYKTGHVDLPIHAGASDLSRQDTLSFGESHATELSSIDTTDMTTQPQVMHTPPPGPPPASATSPVVGSPLVKTAVPMPIPANRPVVDPPSPRVDTSKVQSPPLDPSALNQSPAPIPVGPSRGHVPSMSSSSPPPIVPSESNSALPPATPTVAETGVPVSGGTGGPSSGSLKDLKSSPMHASSKAPIPTPIAEEAPPPITEGGHFESAEAEKRRLAEQYSQAASQKQLEHEQDLARQPSTSRKPGPGEEDLPPYQDM